MKLKIIYVLLLFIIYRAVFKVTGIAPNTAMYGLFTILLFFYYITGNLDFDINKQSKYKSIYLNGLIFLIFLFFYKKAYIFVAFLIFSTFQIPVQRFFKKLNIDEEERYNPSIVNARNGIKLLLDAGSICVAVVLSFMLKYDKGWSMYLRKEYLLIYLSIFLLGYIYKKMSEKSWSYTNILDVLNLLCVNIFTAIIFTIFIYFAKNYQYPWVILFLVTLVSVSLQLFGRYIFRLQRYLNGNRGKGPVIKRALIYGAGEAGAILARESFTSPVFPYKIVGFIDDDFKKVGTEIYKVKVLGTMKSIQKIIENEKIDEILLALPSIKGEEIRKIVEQIQVMENVKIKTVPGIPKILEDKELSTQLRNVRIEDLLGRDEICINDTSIRDFIEGNTIFVTGGAGSIGSELARQIARFNPRELVAIDVNENDIYFLELELRRLYPNLNFVSEIYVRIEDLLGRDEICINDTSIRDFIEGNTIFVTGGAGSIGSELARQIARFNPRELVAIDVNENDIYFLELELRRLYPNLNFVSEICNIREKEKLEFLFDKYRPDIVFHAAAHKHVPLMEHNPEEAIKNNIFGTKNVAECADKYGVKKMVLISTDKAVNPTNLMGASKRACELVIEDMNKVSENTKFMAVRFGNVLGSHGSVIPIFRNLLEQGKFWNRVKTLLLLIKI